MDGKELDETHISRKDLERLHRRIDVIFFVVLCLVIFVVVLFLMPKSAKSRQMSKYKDDVKLISPAKLTNIIPQQVRLQSSVS
jgi:hypothetical protein